jgi:hypothetical protein
MFLVIDGQMNFERLPGEFFFDDELFMVVSRADELFGGIFINAVQGNYARFRSENPP